MPNKDRILAKGELHQLIFCLLILFLLLILLRLNLLSVYTAILHLLKPDLSHYPYSNPPIFFSIGEALSSIAILFAIYQFKKEKWDIALRIRSYIGPVVFTCMSLGILFSITASVVTFKNPTNILHLSMFWQIIASILIAFSVAFLFLKATNKKLFNKKSSRKFYQVIVRDLSRPSSQHLNNALEALLDNFEGICIAASEKDDSEANQSAKAILDVVLGEATLVEILTTKRLDALHYIIYVIEKYNIDQRQAPGFLVIVRGLFINEESFFYKHLNKDGLALSSNIYESTFESPKILNNFNLFGHEVLEPSVRNESSIAIRVFIEALSKAIMTYLKNGNIPIGYINDGLEYLSDTFGNICRKISIEEDRGVDTKYILKDDWGTLHNITHFLGHSYPFLAYRDTLNPSVIEREKTAYEASFRSTSTINAGIAAILYNAFGQLSHLKKTTDIYYVVLGLLEGMMYYENYKEGYRNPFEKRIWEQIAHNVIDKHYPNVLRTFLTFIGFTLSAEDDAQREGWIGKQTEKVRRLLYVDLKPLLDKDEKMVNEKSMVDVLLPASMTYENGKFTYTNGFGKGEKRIIPEPPAGSTSALDGINRDGRSSLS